MNIFISYSTDDISIVKKIAAIIRPKAGVKYWDQDYELGLDSWEQIFDWIDKSDMLLAVITDSTIKRGISVGTEVGYAVAQGVDIVPLLGSDVNAGEIGYLNTITYERIDPANLVKTEEKLLAKIKSEKIRSFLKGVGIGAIIGAIALSSKNSGNSNSKTR